AAADAALTLLRYATAFRATEAQAREWARAGAARSTAYGPRLVVEYWLNAAALLTGQKGYEAVARAAAERAGAALPANAADGLLIRTQSTLVAALKAAGDLDAVRREESRRAELDVRL